MKNMLKQMLGAAACCAICTTLPLLPASAAEVTLGDVNADSAINATDASEILVYATEVGAGTAQAALNTALADVNGDGTVNALDASDVLVYTSKTGSGYTGTMEQHIRSKKNFEYYHTLSDYEVYAEYCEMYGFEVEEELPSEEELPHYKAFQYYITPNADGDEGNVQFWLDCDRIEAGRAFELEKQPELFGFPEEWCYEGEIEYFYDENGEPCGYTQVQKRVLYVNESGSAPTYQIDINFYHVSYWEEDYVEFSYQDSIIDVYRIRLALQNSDFCAQYVDYEYMHGVQFYIIES